MIYSPGLEENVMLSTDKPLHMHFDHPNHNGFSPKDHLLAADYHNRIGRSASNDYRKALFHFAQRDLHALAAQGKPTRIGHVPSESFLSKISPDKQDFWRNKAKEQEEINSQLKAIEKYRLTNVLSDSTSDTTSSQRMMNMFSRARNLAKSKSSADYSLARKIEMDKDPPPPVLVAKETKNSLDPEYRQLLETILAKRKAERGGEIQNQQPGQQYNTTTANTDPRLKLSSDHLDMIRDKIANRNRGGGGW